MLLIASATVHCCHLIVTCKKLAVLKILELEDDLINSTAILSPSKQKLRQRIERSLSYGDIAWVGAGKWGLALVNFGLVVTQFGFCVGYFIFLGNTFSNFFPLVNGTISLPSATISPSITQNATTAPPVTTAMESLQEDTFVQYVSSNLTGLNPSLQHSGPEAIYYILVASLVPIFAMFALLRNIRQLGSSSLIANISMLIGYFSVLGYVLSGMYVMY